MNALESELKELIVEKYGSLKKFTEIIGMPWTTLDSILKRGVANSNITNVLKISNELNVDAENLVSGRIRYKIDSPQTIAAHFEGNEYSEEQIERIKAFAAFIKSEEKK